MKSRDARAAIGEHLTQLEAELDQAVGLDRPLSQEEAAWILSEAHRRLAPVQGTLRWRTLGERVRGALRARRRAVRLWLGPRIGQLNHYPPRPIELPRSYFRTRPMTGLPTISLATPSYQQGRFIERTIRSVLTQGYPALEYLVQDGGSTDDSTEVIERYAPWLAGWTSEEDSGQADAINRAFAKTSGEIMGWLNSDDLLLPGALAYVGQYFAAHPDVDVVYGNRVLIDDGDGEIGRWILPRHNDAILKVADFVPQETLFWRRRIWDAVGAQLDTSFTYAMDWDLLLRFQAAGAKMVHLNRFLGSFRVHDSQKTTAAAPTGLEEMARLRTRSFGRAVAVEEFPELLRPYFIRHRIVHARFRFVERVFPAEAHAPDSLEPIPLPSGIGRAPRQLR